MRGWLPGPVRRDEPYRFPGSVPISQEEGGCPDGGIGVLWASDESIPTMLLRPDTLERMAQAVEKVRERLLRGASGLESLTRW
ncbi:MAG: hypothetical protein AMXMBFR33_58940 [Candidatus Xenobia bacterium]